MSFLANRAGGVESGHALRLQAALTAAGVPIQPHTVVGGGHGGFSPEQEAVKESVRQGEQLG